MLFLEQWRLVPNYSGNNYEPKWPTSVYLECIPNLPTTVIVPNDLVVDEGA